MPRYAHLLQTVKRILMCTVLAWTFLAGGSPRMEAQDGWYWGTIIRNPPASYVLQMDDGKLLDAEWTSGNDDWSIGDRVMLTTKAAEAICSTGTGAPRSMSFSMTLPKSMRKRTSNSSDIDACRTRTPHRCSTETPSLSARALSRCSSSGLIAVT
jgi:hypothetical protein